LQSKKKGVVRELITMKKILFIVPFLLALVLFLFNYRINRKNIEYIDMATQYAKDEQYDKAIEYYQRVINAMPPEKTSGGHLGIALMYQRKGDNTKAREYCQKATELDPNIMTQEAYQFCNTLR